MSTPQHPGRISLDPRLLDEHVARLHRAGRQGPPPVYDRHRLEDLAQPPAPDPLDDDLTEPNDADQATAAGYIDDGVDYCDLPWWAPR